MSLYGFGDMTDSVLAGTQVDMNTIVKALRVVKASADAAQIILQQGMTALSAADDAATKAAAGAGEQAKRDKIRAHLQYYIDNPDKLASGFYDIRNYTIQAFIMYNASVEVSQQSVFWPAVWSSIKDLPSTIGTAVGTVASSAGSLVGATAAGLLQGLASNPIGLVTIAGLGLLLIMSLKRRP